MTEQVELDGLIAEEPRTKKTTVFKHVALSEIEEPETPSDPPDKKLVESVERHGIIEPVALLQIDKNRYQVIEGRRRIAAARIVGHAAIAAYVDLREVVPLEVLSLAANHVRSVNKLDAYAKLVALSDRGYTRAQIAKATGMAIAQIDALLRTGDRLRPELREAVREKKMTWSAAENAARLSDRRQIDLVVKLRDEGKLSNVDVEEVKRELRQSAVANLPTSLFETVNDPDYKMKQAIADVEIAIASVEATGVAPLLVESMRAFLSEYREEVKS